PSVTTSTPARSCACTASRVASSAVASKSASDSRPSRCSWIAASIQRGRGQLPMPMTASGGIGATRAGGGSVAGTCTGVTARGARHGLLHRSVTHAGAAVGEELDQLRAADDARTGHQVVLVELALLEARRADVDRAAGLSEVVHQLSQGGEPLLVDPVGESP